MTTPDLESIFRQAVLAVGGRALCRRALEADRPSGQVMVAGAGKAACAMALGVEDALGDTLLGGIIVAKAGQDLERPARVRVIEGAHPVPDISSMRAAQLLLQTLRAVPPDLEVLFLLSGGASALLGAPLPGISEQEYADTGRALVRSGLSIQDMNAIRKHLSRASGGRIALAVPGPIRVLVISDVLGNDLSSIGSGPLSPDPTSFADARALAARVPDLPAAALRVLEAGARRKIAETPKPGDPRLAHVRHEILADNGTLIDAALEVARAAGLPAERLPATEAPVAEVAETYAALLAGRPEVLWVGGGEPSLAVPLHAGPGGRARHLALAMALGMRGRRGAFLAAGSDGIDGSDDAAGALVDGDTCAAADMDCQAALGRFEATAALSAAGALIAPGHTGTNVLDLHLLWT